MILRAYLLGERPRLFGEREYDLLEGDLERRSRMRSRGEGDLRRGEGDLRRGEGDLRRGEGDLRRGEGDLRRGDGERFGERRRWYGDGLRE